MKSYSKFSVEVIGRNLEQYGFGKIVGMKKITYQEDNVFIT